MPGIDIFIYSSSYDTRPATSNAQGFAVFFNLEPGRYLVTARRQTPLTAGCMLVVNGGADEDYTAILSAHLIPPQVLYDSPYCRSRDPLHAGVTADVYDIF